MRKIITLGITLVLLLASVGMGDDTCMLPSHLDSDSFVTFNSPVIPPNQTMSGNFVYLGLFRPRKEGLWEGNVVKLGIDQEGRIIDRSGTPALDAKGNLRPDAAPFWATKDWADPLKHNYIHNTARNIYTYLGASHDLTAWSNAFKASNAILTAPLLGLEEGANISKLIDYIRGADAFDEDNDGITTENRSFITGDVMHSSPLVVQYLYPDGSSRSVVFFGANDGMLHAVLDVTTTADGSTTQYGQEIWAFIPPDQLHRLKKIPYDTAHTYFIDSSPKAYCIDVNGNGVLDVTDGDMILLICGERKGGKSYFCLDITDPERPAFLWRISPTNDTSLWHLPSAVAPNTIIPELGQTWSEPVFGRVKTDDDDLVGTPVFFIGGGYSPDNSAGKAILAINPLDGSLVRRFKNGVGEILGMDFSIPSSVAAIDEDGNGFTDKLYVGDTGGQIWRVGRFTDSNGDLLPFPQSNENINSWTAHRLFIAPSWPNRMFFYPPSVALENDYDLLLIGSGNREDPCDLDSLDRIYAIKDLHDDSTLTEDYLVDVTSSPSSLPDLDNNSADVDANGIVDRGWLIRLQNGEKVLDKGLLFNKVYYLTTFTPDGDLGVARSYALNYKTGVPVTLADEEGNDTWSGVKVIGVSIPSRPIIYVSQSKLKLFYMTATPSYGGGSVITPVPKLAILSVKPVLPSSNLFYLWWMIL